MPVDYTIALGGAMPGFDIKKDLVLDRIAGNSYAISVYSDVIVPADYYGLGVCRWRLDAINIRFNAVHDVGLGIGGEWITEEERTDELVQMCPMSGHPSRPVWGCLSPQAITQDSDTEYFPVYVIKDDNSKYPAP